MNASTGSEKIVFCREAIAPRAPRRRASGFASPPASTLRALPMTICWFGQMTIHTLASHRDAHDDAEQQRESVELVQKSLSMYVSGSTKISRSPNATVAAAAQRNHHSARHVNLSSASLRATGIDLGEGGDLHEVEEPQKTDPHHRDDDMADP